MEVIEVYLFHGFLGLPADWSGFAEALQKEVRGQGIHCRIQAHNLWIDYEKMIADAPHGGRDYFSVWAEYKRKEFSHLAQKKVFLGYSLGGRLLMHLPLIPDDNVIAVGYVSAHPGMQDPEDRRQRRMTDLFWSDSFIDTPWEELMASWNQQEAFANDAIRPHREEHNYNRDLLSRYFKDWSLANQEPREEQFRLDHLNQFWFYGEKDENIKHLIPRMQNLVGTKRCMEVPKAGHGILWENPTYLGASVASIIRDYLDKEAEAGD